MVAAVTVISASFIGVGVLSATYTSTSTTGASSFTTGTVTFASLTPTSVATISTQATLRPGDGESWCLTAIYSGNLPADVRMYATAGPTQTLAGAIDVTVEGPLTSGSCATFPTYGSHASAVTETLTAFQARTWTTGISGWTPSGGTATAYYRVSYRFTRGTAATSKVCSFAFTLEARST